MRLETVSEFKIMQSKKDIGYTYFRFDKNAHKDLGGCPVAAINVNGTYILIPFSKSKYKSRVITDEMIDERLNQVVQSIQSENKIQREKKVKTDPRAYSVDGSQMDQELERKCIRSEKSAESSGRSKPPSVLCGIRLRVKPGPGPDARLALF